MLSSRSKPSVHDPQSAGSLAIRALAFLAADEERLQTFLTLSGISPQDIRAAAGQPHFLAGVLDHLLGDEAGLLLPFAAGENIRPEDVAAACQTLEGGPLAG